MAHKMKFVYRIVFTIIILSFSVLFFFLGRYGYNESPIIFELTKSKASRILQENFVPPYPVVQNENTQRTENNTTELSKHLKASFNHSEKLISPISPTATIVLTVVICGDRVNETLVMLKSAAALTQSPLLFVIVAEDSLRESVQHQLSKWPVSVKNRVRFKLYPITFPLDTHVEEWKKLFKPCAAQRLFLPTLLQDIDALLYVDTDVLFLRPLEHIWKYFSLMNASQMAAMTPEHEDFATGWYNRFARHPYYKPLGVNSGVMLMNLTRMRKFNWQSYVIPIYEEYKYKITWGDQDIINIIFHYHPDKVYVYPCEWNFRSDHCMYMSVCKSAEENGVGVLHGNRAVFHNDKQIAFKAIFETFYQYNLGENLRTHLVIPMEKALKRTIHTNCGKLYRLFLKALKKYLPTS